MRIWIVICVWMLVSCNEIRDCSLTSSRDGAVLAFYEADSTDKFRKGTFFLINSEGTLDTIRPSGNTNAVLAALNPSADTVYYSFRVLDSLAPNNYIEYNLWVHYNTQIEIYAEECEPIMNYELDSVFSPDFDSVALLAGPADKQVNVNVEIYF